VIFSVRTLVQPNVFPDVFHYLIPMSIFCVLLQWNLIKTKLLFRANYFVIVFKNLVILSFSNPVIIQTFDLLSFISGFFVTFNNVTFLERNVWKGFRCNEKFVTLWFVIFEFVTYWSSALYWITLYIGDRCNEVPLYTVYTYNHLSWVIISESSWQVLSLMYTVLYY
jgi:hypothetical protein